MTNKETQQGEEPQMPKKPLRVMYSPLSRQFYAFSTYKREEVDGREIITVTGEKHNVTQDIARAIAEHAIEFKEITPQ